jgi:hypothetical protein
MQATVRKRPETLRGKAIVSGASRKRRIKRFLVAQHEVLIEGFSKTCKALAR